MRPFDLSEIIADTADSYVRLTALARKHGDMAVICGAISKTNRAAALASPACVRFLVEKTPGLPDPDRATVFRDVLNHVGFCEDLNAPWNRLFRHHFIADATNSEFDMVFKRGVLAYAGRSSENMELMRAWCREAVIVEKPVVSSKHRSEKGPFATHGVFGKTRGNRPPADPVISRTERTLAWGLRRYTEHLPLWYEGTNAQVADLRKQLMPSGRLKLPDKIYSDIPKGYQEADTLFWHWKLVSKVTPDPAPLREALMCWCVLVLLMARRHRVTPAALELVRDAPWTDEIWADLVHREDFPLWLLTKRLPGMSEKFWITVQATFA